RNPDAFGSGTKPTVFGASVGGGFSNPNAGPGSLSGRQPPATFEMRKFALFTIAAILLGVTAIPARAFTHPCIPTTTQDLDYIKANLNHEPWKNGYAQLLATWNPNHEPRP